ncbi:MAG: DUF4124 domain-containing protein, partial [Pseudomonadota bacterium]
MLNSRFAQALLLGGEGYTADEAFPAVHKMMRRLGYLVLLGALAASWGTAAHAQWKWRDKGGQLHVSDLPPPSDVAEKDVLQRPANARRPAAAPVVVAASAADPGPAAKLPGETELEARVRKAEQER